MSEMKSFAESGIDTTAIDDVHIDKMVKSGVLMKCPTDYRATSIVNAAFIVLTLLTIAFFSIYVSLPEELQKTANSNVMAIGAVMIALWFVIGKILFRGLTNSSKMILHVGSSAAMLLLGIRLSLYKDWLGIFLVLFFYMIWALNVVRNYGASNILLVIYNSAVIQPRHDLLKRITERIEKQGG